MAFWGRICTIRLSSIVDPLRTVFELNRRQISVLSVPPRLEADSGVVTVADRPYIVLGSNRKSMAASSFLLVLPCFHFQLSRKCLTATGSTFRWRPRDSEHAKCGGVYFTDSVVSTFAYGANTENLQRRLTAPARAVRVRNLRRS